eukprot:tig00000204_g17689.t1
MPPKGGAKAGGKGGKDAKPTTPRDPDEPPPPDPEEVKRQVQEFCTNEVEVLWRNVLEIVTEKYYESRELPFSIERVCEDMLGVVDWYYIEHDPGVQNAHEDPSWLQDAEPTPTPIDTWARAVVPVRRRFKLELHQNPSAGSIGPGSGRRVGSNRSRPGSRGSRPGSARSAISPIASERSNAVSLKEGSVSGGPGKAGKPSRPQARKIALPSVPQGKEMQVTASYREEMAQREAAERMQRKLEEEIKTEQVKFAKLKKELEGKEFTYDRNGNIIVISTLEPDKLPSGSVNPRVALQPTAEEEAAAAAAAERAKRGGRGAPPKKDPPTAEQKRAAAAAKKRAAEGPYGQRDVVLHAAASQPPVIETITMKAGVTLRDGGRTKAGPRPPPDERHMSRKDFTATFGGSGGRGRARDDDAGRRPPMTAGGGNVPSDPGAFSGPARLPAAPAAKEGALGSRPRFPRDRPYVNKSPPRHLPPPVAPNTTGHGFNTAYFADLSQVAVPSRDATAPGASLGFSLDRNSTAGGQAPPRAPSVATNAGTYPREFAKIPPESQIRTMNPRLASALVSSSPNPPASRPDSRASGTGGAGRPAAPAQGS